MPPRIGALAVQGDFREHAAMLRGLGADVVEVRKPVLVRDGRVLAASFHPELTGDTRVHELFLELVEDALGLGRRSPGRQASGVQGSTRSYDQAAPAQDPAASGGRVRRRSASPAGSRTRPGGRDVGTL